MRSAPLVPSTPRLVAAGAAHLHESARITLTGLIARYPRSRRVWLSHAWSKVPWNNGDYAQVHKLAKKYSEFVAPQQNPRKMESYHELLALIQLLQRKYGPAVEQCRQADLTNMYTQYHLALALEGAKQQDEARRLFKEVGEWKLNTVGYALVRKDVLARAG